MEGHAVDLGDDLLDPPVRPGLLDRGATHHLGPPRADGPAVLGDVDGPVAAEHAGVRPAAAVGIVVEAALRGPGHDLAGVRLDHDDPAVGQDVRALRVAEAARERIDRSPHRVLLLQAPRALLEQLDGIAVGIGHVAAARALVRTRRDVDDLFGPRREPQPDQPGVHRLDVVDVEAQVARAVVAWPRRGGHPFDADVLEQLHEAAAGDPQVDGPDVVELEAQHRRQVRRVEDPVEFLLQAQPVAVEDQGAVHVADGDPAVEEPGDGRHRRPSYVMLWRSVDRVATVWRPT